jgi:hypothetical protein
MASSNEEEAVELPTPNSNQIQKPKRHQFAKEEWRVFCTITIFKALSLSCMWNVLSGCRVEMWRERAASGF